MVTFTELAVAVTVVLAALFGSERVSERSFRLLRWLVNRPEPSPPRTFRDRNADPTGSVQS